MKSLAVSTLGYQEWKKRLLDGDENSLIHEKLGALQHGSVFFGATGDNGDPIALYLALADRFMTNDIYPLPNWIKDAEVMAKARSVLVKHFFKVHPVIDYWNFITVVAFSPDLLPVLIHFLCSARRGIAKRIDFFKWNYQFVDDAYAERSKHDAKQQHEDKTISSFLSHLLWLLMQGITPHSEQRRLDLKKALKPYEKDILLEIFIRAPWQLLPFRMDKEWVEVFEKDLKQYPEVHPRTFEDKVNSDDRMCNYRHHDLPSVAAPTRAEVLTVLKSRTYQ
ncbi:MAG TPA: hypothetical protein VIR98_00955 [Candidatus Paceibacterota bacterium]|jgi:hypothetical protein